MTRRPPARYILRGAESVFIVSFLFIVVVAVLVNSGLLGYRFEPLGRLGGALSDRDYLYVARFSPAAILRYDSNYNLVNLTPLNVSPMEMSVVEGQVQLIHAGQVYHPTENLQFGLNIQAVCLHRNLLGHPYAWDEQRRRWVPLQSAWVTLFQMWPAVPLSLVCFVAAMICRTVRTRRNPFAIGITPGKTAV